MEEYYRKLTEFYSNLGGGSLYIAGKQQMFIPQGSPVKEAKCVEFCGEYGLLFTMARTEEDLRSDTVTNTHTNGKLVIIDLTPKKTKKKKKKKKKNNKKKKIEEIGNNSNDTEVVDDN